MDWYTEIVLDRLQAECVRRGRQTWRRFLPRPIRAWLLTRYWVREAHRLLEETSNIASVYPDGNSARHLAELQWEITSGRGVWYMLMCACPKPPIRVDLGSEDDSEGQPPLDWDTEGTF